MTDKSAGVTRSSFTYGRDNASQVTSVASTGSPSDTHGYTYSPLNQLKTLDAAAYAYDAADNLTTVRAGETLTYDPANQAIETAWYPRRLLTLETRMEHGNQWWAA